MLIIESEFNKKSLNSSLNKNEYRSISKKERKIVIFKNKKISNYRILGLDRIIPTEAEENQMKEE
jgi:hypothetical protein